MFSLPFSLAIAFRLMCARYIFLLFAGLVLDVLLDAVRCAFCSVYRVERSGRETVPVVSW